MSRIFIEEPCKEKWHKMIPLNEGRLCQSCNTPVLDFTQKSEQEILDYFAKRNDEHFCGKYAASTVSTPNSIRFKWILIALTLIFGTGLISSCRRHIKGRFKFPVQTKVKTEISNPKSHGTPKH
jgi:hypothetical protein